MVFRVFGGSALGLGCGAPRRSEVRGQKVSKERQLLECGDASPLSTFNAQHFNEEGFVARHSADRGQTSGVRRQMSEVRRPVIVRDSRLSIHVLDSRDHSSTTTKAPGERNTNGSAFALLGVPGSTPKDGNANNPDDDCGA